MIGTSFFNYKITEKIGSGGMGIVYKAYHETLDKTVAIKVITDRLLQDPTVIKRFEREAKVMAKLNHPNIVRVENIGRIQKRPAFVMEFIEGRNLEEIIREQNGSMAVPETIRIITQLAEALRYAHSQDPPVIHRDIKPSNILLTSDGIVRVSDFGLAKIIGVSTKTSTGYTSHDDSLGELPTDPSRLTATHSTPGTLRYMSPEQQVTPSKVNHQTDIYSVGVLLYEMLTTMVPMQTTFRKPGVYNKDVCPELDHACMKCLEGELKQRYASVDEFLHDLEVAEAASLTYVNQRNAVRTAKEHLHRREYAQAIAGLQSLLTDNPDHREAADLLSGARAGLELETIISKTLESCENLIRGKKFEEAEAVLKPVLERAPRNASLNRLQEKLTIEGKKHRKIQDLMKEGLLFFLEEDYEQAIDRYGTILKLDPDQAEAAQQIEVAQEKLNRKETEIAALQSKAEDEIREKRFRNALKILREIHTRNPSLSDIQSKIDRVTKMAERQDSVESHLAKAGNHIRQGQYPEAAREAERALAIDASHDRAKKLLESAHLELKKKRDSIARKLVEAQAEFSAGRFNEARRRIETCLEMEPEHEESKKLLEDINRTEDNLLREKKRKLDNLRNAAIRTHEAGQLDQALAHWQAVLETEATHAEAREKLASIRKEMEERRKKETVDNNLARSRELFDADKFDDALSAIGEILAMDAQNPAALELRKRIESEQHKRGRFEQLQREAAAYESEEKFREAYLCRRELLKWKPGDNAAANAATEARANLLKSGQAALDDGDFRSASAMFRTIQEHEPGHRESAGLLEIVEQNRKRKRRKWLIPAGSLAVGAVIVAMIWMTIDFSDQPGDTGKPAEVAAAAVKKPTIAASTSTPVPLATRTPIPTRPAPTPVPPTENPVWTAIPTTRPSKPPETKPDPREQAARLRLANARTFIENGALESAETEIRAVEQTDLFPAETAELMQSLAQKRQAQQAEVAARKNLQTVNGLLQKAATHRDRKEFGPALAVLNEAKGIVPGDRRIADQIGATIAEYKRWGIERVDELISAGQYDEASNRLRELEAAIPGDGDVARRTQKIRDLKDTVPGLLAEAENLYRQNRLKEALDAANKVLEYRKNEPAAMDLIKRINTFIPNVQVLSKDKTVELKDFEVQIRVQSQREIASVRIHYLLPDATDWSASGMAPVKDGYIYKFDRRQLPPGTLKFRIEIFDNLENSHRSDIFDVTVNKSREFRGPPPG
ncbi:protein kinase [bacterium]|nr:protein kinase [candidate division CSSED10-310 bacterium]